MYAHELPVRYGNCAEVGIDRWNIKEETKDIRQFQRAK